MRLEQTEEAARVIIAQYGFLKVTEIMLFLHHIKAGRYGHFYGTVDPQRITDALREFLEWRYNEISRIEKQREQERWARELEERKKTAITYDEYIALKNGNK